MVGSWQFFEIGNSDNAADIQFQFQGNDEFKVTSGNEKNPIVTGTWNLAKESVLVASEPFVEQDEYILQLNIQSKTDAIDLPEEMRLIQIKKSRILMRYVQDKRGHKIRLTRILAN